MFYNQTVCGRCFHRFTTAEDASLHYAIFHDNQPKASDIMHKLNDLLILCEQILITVSRDPGIDPGPERGGPPPKPNGDDPLPGGAAAVEPPKTTAVDQIINGGGRSNRNPVR